MKIVALLLTVCLVCVKCENTAENTGVRIALKIYDDCISAEAFSTCLKKKAVTFLDRLGRMDNFTIGEGITLLKTSETTGDEILNETQLEKTLSRSSGSKDEALNAMLMDKFSKFIGSRSLEVTMPKFSLDSVGEGRGDGDGGFGGFGGFGGGGHGGGGHGGGGHGGGFDFGGGKGGGKGDKKGGMMNGLMLAIAAKFAAMIPVAIAGLFLLAGKALITAKIALLLSGIIAIKKLFAAKQGGGAGGSHGGGWQSSGHGGGGWQSAGAGWDKRSIEAQHLAYNAYSPK